MGLEFIGEKNINTTIGKRMIPITLSNKKPHGNGVEIWDKEKKEWVKKNQSLL